jgi:hypothetical protein
MKTIIELSEAKYDLQCGDGHYDRRQISLAPTKPNYQPMKIQLIIRRFAGTFIIASLLLAHFYSPNWLWFTAFVGFNLLQSSFTNFCPLEIVLKKMGVGCDCGCPEKKSGDSCRS